MLSNPLRSLGFGILRTKPFTGLSSCNRLLHRHHSPFFSIKYNNTTPSLFRKFATMAQSQGNFDLVKTVNLDYAPGMSVEKWKSRVTGMTVYWANFESPLLNCYCTIASEIFNDSGVPHTLEHLIFLGSELYPYKGMLDTLANRAFAQGTNAWTAQDHTAYTLTTAGSDGFLRMLPIYLDHVFHPTLTKEGFVTEVYHVNGKGEDAGVVFSEMQGCENVSSSLMQLAYQRKVYPTSSAYRSETGGLMSALRVLTIDEIRQYHHKYYEPYNTALVVCGPLDRKVLFDSIQPVEERLVQHGINGAPQGWKRPFMETPSAQVPQMKEHRTAIVVDFPERDESMGEVMISWNGPRVDDWVTAEAISLLGTYLTDSAVSPIQQAFVEREDPLCTDVYYSTTDKAGASTIEMYMSSVPTEHLEGLDKKLVDEVLSKVAEKEFDMERISMLIKRERVKLLNMLETKPADAFSDVIINDFLYGSQDGQDLQKSMDEMKRFDILDSWTSDQWVNLLKQYLIANQRVVISGKPSSKLSDSLKSETKALIEKRKADLGDEGLQKLAEIVKEAQKANDIPIPKDVLTKFQIPNVDSINWIGVGIATENGPQRSGVEESNEASDKKLRQYLKQNEHTSLPFAVHWGDIRSNFVTLTMLFNTASLPARLRPLMSLFMSSIWSLPIKQPDGTRLTYEEVVKGLDQDTLEYDANLGYGSGFAEMASMEIKVERSKYEQGFNWLRDIIWFSELSLDRIRVNGSKVSQSLPEQRRDGRMMSWALARSLTHSGKLSTNINNSILKQSEVIPDVVSRLSSDKEAQQVIKELQELKDILFQPKNMIVAIAGDITSLPAPHAPLVSIANTLGWNKSVTDTAKVQIPFSRDVLTPLGQSPSTKGVITPLSTIESSFAVFSAKGIAGWNEPDSAALAVTISVLNALESYLWRYIRGAGLAYGASIRSDIEAQLIHFTLYRSPDSAKAFTAAADVIGKLVKGEIEMDDTVLDSAKSSLCFSVADSEGTVGQAATEAFSDTVLRGLPKGRGRWLLAEAKKVTQEQVRACLAKYIQPIFDPKRSICAIACSPSNIDEMQEALQKIGYEMEKKELNYADEEDEESSGSDSDDEGDESDSDMSGVEEDGKVSAKQKL